METDPEEKPHGTPEDEQSSAPAGSASEATDTASRWVWWIAQLAIRQPYPRPTPKIGDTVIEVTHIMSFARSRLGLHKAFGTLLEIDSSKGEWNQRYLIKSVDPECGETWWGNARIEVVEQNEKPLA